MKVYFEFENDDQAKLLDYNLRLIRAARKDPNGISDMMSDISSIVAHMCYLSQSDIYTREEIDNTLLWYAKQLTRYQEPISKWIVEDDDED